MVWTKNPYYRPSVSSPLSRQMHSSDDNSGDNGDETVDRTRTIKLPEGSGHELQLYSEVFRAVCVNSDFGCNMTNYDWIQADVKANFNDDDDDQLDGTVEITGYCAVHLLSNVIDEDELYLSQKNGFRVVATFVDGVLHGDWTRYHYVGNTQFVETICQRLYEEGNIIAQLYISVNEMELSLNSRVEQSHQFPDTDNVHTILQRHPQLSPDNNNWQTKLAHASILCDNFSIIMYNDFNTGMYNGPQ